MRILVCTLEVPLPPVNGMRLQVGALVNELRRRHDVRLVGLAFPDQERAGLPAPEPWMRVIRRPPGRTGRLVRNARSALLRRPPGVTEYASELRGTLREELASFRPDVVHVTPGDLALLGRELRGRPAVFAPLDAWHENVAAEIPLATGVRRALLPIAGRFVRRFVRIEYGRFARVVTVSDEDAAALRTAAPDLLVTVIPNGVDLEFFAPADAPRDPDLLVFSGVMDYGPNVAAARFLAEDVLPLVRSARPSVRLAIVGRDPASSVVALARHRWVDVVGTVPDMRPWLRRCSAYACPMISGTGIKNKLLEAMAVGSACVVTPLALRGTSAAPGRDVLMASGAAGLADALLAVLAHRGVAERLGASARSYVEANHSWSAVASRFERLYEEEVARSSAI